MFAAEKGGKCRNLFGEVEMYKKKKLRSGAALLLTNLVFIIAVCVFIFSGIGASAAVFSGNFNYKEFFKPRGTSSAEESAAPEGLKKVLKKTLGEGIFLNNSSGIELDFDAVATVLPALKAKSAEGPEVLVVHTHTTEAFMTRDDGFYNPETYAGRSTDMSKNVYTLGEVFCAELEKNGIKTVHDDAINDHPNFSGSYTKTAKVIEYYLKKYPSIRVVIDLHRDSLTIENGSKYRPVAENGAAQVMIVAGCYKGGLDHPDYKENLRFAMLWQRQMQGNNKTLARPLSFVKYRYNQHLTTGSLILEVGADANLLPEAKLAAKESATALAEVLKTLP